MNSNPLRPGDVIRAYGLSFTIAKIFYQDWYGPRDAAPECSDFWGYDVEFRDTEGRYHHWKQNEDGGDVIRKEASL